MLLVRWLRVRWLIGSGFLGNEDVLLDVPSQAVGSRPVHEIIQCWVVAVGMNLAVEQADVIDHDDGLVHVTKVVGDACHFPFDRGVQRAFVSAVS